MQIKTKGIFILFIPLTIMLFFSIIGCGGGTGTDVNGTVITSSNGSSNNGSNTANGNPQEIEGTVTLAWDANKEPTLGGYKIYYGTTSGSYENSIDVGLAAQLPDQATTYTLAGLIKDQRYYIAITAYDTFKNESGLSNEVSGVAA